MTSHFISHLILISQFELKRLFSTRKGLLYLITFVLVWCLILFYPIRIASDFFNQNQAIHGNILFEFIGLGQMLNWEIPEFGVYWRFSLFIFPILSVMTTADQTGSDRERGTLRFLSLRTSKLSLFFGRFCGAVVIQLLLIAFTLFTVFLFSLYQGVDDLTMALNYSLAIAVNLFIVILPFTALMAVLSVMVKSAKQATVWAILILTFLSGIIGTLSSYQPWFESLKLFVPGYQIAEIAPLSNWEPLQFAYIPLLQSLVLLVIGRWIMLRHSL